MSMLLKGLSFQNVLPIKTENIIKVASLLLHTSSTPAYVYATTVACPQFVRSVKLPMANVNVYHSSIQVLLLLKQFSGTKL